MKKLSTKILVFAKKYKAVKLLGGSCKMCGEDNILKLCFHHIDDKKESLNVLRNYSWNIIEKELKKCELYCQNCHQELHEKIGKVSNKRHNKHIYLKYLGDDKCYICGYNKCNSSLNFHHERNKDFILSDITSRFDSIKDLSEKVQNELDKCKIICRNCHTIKHTDSKFFYENLDEIIEKSNNLKYKQPKIDREKVYDMYFNQNIKQVKIAEYFCASKGTISDIIKKLKMC